MPESPETLPPAGADDPATAATKTRPPSPVAHVPLPFATRTMVGVVLVLALVAVLAAWLDGRRTTNNLRGDVAARLGDIETTAQAAGKAQAQLAAEVRDAQAKVALLETRLAESQAQQAALEALYRDLAPSRDEIALTEIEQVLLIASQQLALAGNVQSALAALQLADAKLQRLDRPQFVPLRRSLVRDMDDLKSVPYVDIAALSVKIDQALASIDALPLAMDERLPAPPPEAAVAAPDEPAWRRFLRDVWADVRQLVRVEVSDRPAAPLVPPPQQFFLRENLKLRLLSARIALLNRDDAAFKGDVGAADAWIRQFFDMATKPVQALSATLKQLAATPMPAGAPDLTRSLEALRLLRLAQDRPPGQATPRPAAR